MGASKGFTLAELAVAIAIVGVLVFAAIVPFSAQIDIRNVADTRRTMDSIRDAIIGFAQTNGRLPCPANGNVASGSAGAGAEQFDGTNCVAAFGAFGVVPWATLGTSETDAWGRRFSYRVSPAFADAVNAPSPPNPVGTLQATWNTLKNPYAPPGPPPTYLPQFVSTPASKGDQVQLCHLTAGPAQSSFAMCTLGDITVYTRSSPGTAAAPLVASVPVIIISHGKNGLGGWQTSGVQLPIPTPGSDEAANANGNTFAGVGVGPYQMWNFYSRTPTPAATGCADPAPLAAGGAGTPFCEFDDIVVAISANTLIARMVAAGKLP